MPYEQIEASLVSDASDADGILFRADGKFRLLSPELVWIRYSSLITKSVIKDFADVVRYLLSDIDPTAGMTGEERLTAQFLGKRPEFSGTLRRNVVHSLAIAGSIGPTRLNLDSSMSPSFVDWVVRSTLEKASFERWASFRDELSILAEAAPDALLDALERDAQPNGAFAEMMQRTEHTIYNSPPYIGVLWALERMCWSPQYLERATCILLRLAAMNPSNASRNSPANSIHETLQLYCPQTNANWTTRQSTIARMLQEDTETAFKLVISLFPIGPSSWLRRQLPEWRDWAYGYRSGTTYGQIAIERQWCVERLIESAASDVNRWCVLLALCGDIDDAQYSEILSCIESKLSSEAFDQASKRQLWETINRMLIRMEWAANLRRLPSGETIDKDEVTEQDVVLEPHFSGEVERFERYGPRLQRLREASVPQDPVLAGCHAFLCGEGSNHFAEHFSDRFKYEKQQELIKEARTAIVENVWRVESLNGFQRPFQNISPSNSRMLVVCIGLIRRGSQKKAKLNVFGNEQNNSERAVPRPPGHYRM